MMYSHPENSPIYKTASRYLRILLLLYLFVFVFFQTHSLSAYEPSPAKKYELSPYLVSIDVTVPYHPVYTPEFIKNINHHLTQELHRFTSTAVTWNISITQAYPQEKPLENLHLVPRITPLNQKTYATDISTDVDKIISTSIISKHNSFELYTQEFDTVTNTTSPIITCQTEDPRSIARLIIMQSVKVFRPLILLTQTIEKTYQASLRAGELGWPEPASSQIKQGDLFTVIHLYQDKKGITQRRIPANWTYLQLQEQDRGELQLNLISAFRAPIAASRRRVQIIGIQAKPVLDETPIHLTRNSDQSPCPGSVIRVFADKVKTPEPGEQPATPLQTLRTDRYGHSFIKTEKDQQLVYLYPLSGDVVLATVPLVPGTQNLVTLSVPDDQLRLNVEAQLSQLNSEMIDIVAARTVLLSRLKRYTNEDKWGQFDLLRPQLDQLNKADHFRSQLNSIRELNLEAARKAKNKTVEKRILTLCTQTQDLFDKYFGDSDYSEMLKELDALRKAQK